MPPAALARLLISLATQQRTAAEPQVLNKSMAYINATFSPDFGHFLLLCLSGGTERPPTVHDAVALVSGLAWRGIRGYPKTDDA